MSRSLAVAVTSVAVAGIAFAGVAPASAAPVGAAAASSATCDDIQAAIRQHMIAADKYQALAKKEAGKAHPDRDKVAQYKAKADDELSAADAYQAKLEEQCRR
ncbi:hypothetical protein OHU45_12880 [Streptomyces tubercidicus]|uniref:hypothetical protein n=1 Tax=Streptomyces tubercidicus TaxID=47759 RepID=UPI002E0F25CA|nr:hypothetical protein OG761_12605 [Streptomyces tubercidicus]WSX22659.1 hypothetical protein OG690_24410 [Streptomyces tubercidicus]